MALAEKPQKTQKITKTRQDDRQKLV